MDRHTNIVSIDEGDNEIGCECTLNNSKKSEESIQNYSLEDFLDFSQSVPLEDILFLQQGVDMNFALAEEGLNMETGIGKKFQKLVKDGLMHEDLSGIICDGGKEGCSYKLALAAGWAVQSALLSMAGAVINTTDGILASDFKEVIRNMGYVCNPGMVETNNAIIKVMADGL